MTYARGAVKGVDEEECGAVENEDWVEGNDGEGEVAEVGAVGFDVVQDGRQMVKGAEWPGVGRLDDMRCDEDLEGCDSLEVFCGNEPREVEE